jgi:hypothetical protein
VLVPCVWTLFKSGYINWRIVQAALLVSKCEAKSIPRVAEEMKVHGLLVCTHLFAQALLILAKITIQKKKKCVWERHTHTVFQSSIVWTYQNPFSLIWMWLTYCVVLTYLFIKWQRDTG